MLIKALCHFNLTNKMNSIYLIPEQVPGIFSGKGGLHERLVRAGERGVVNSPCGLQFG